MEPHEFLHTVRYMCDKPKMRTGSGSFFRVVMFLEGYALAADLGNNSAHSKLSPFLEWVGKTHGANHVMTWERFRGMYASDEEALRALKFLFIKFVTDCLDEASTE